MRTTLKTPLSTSPFFSVSISFPTLLPPLREQPRERGNRSCGQSVMLHLCCFFLLALFPCSSVASPLLQEDNLLHRGLHLGLRGYLFFSAWRTFFPFFFVGLGACSAVCFTYCHSSLTAAVVHQFFPPFHMLLNRDPTTIACGLSLGQ